MKSTVGSTVGEVFVEVAKLWKRKDRGEVSIFQSAEENCGRVLWLRDFAHGPVWRSLSDINDPEIRLFALRPSPLALAY